jgi:hypothetical protein
LDEKRPVKPPRLIGDVPLCLKNKPGARGLATSDRHGATGFSEWSLSLKSAVAAGFRCRRQRLLNCNKESSNYSGGTLRYKQEATCIQFQ